MAHIADSVNAILVKDTDSQGRSVCAGQTYKWVYLSYSLNSLKVGLHRGKCRVKGATWSLDYSSFSTIGPEDVSY